MTEVAGTRCGLGVAFSTETMTRSLSINPDGLGGIRVMAGRTIPRLAGNVIRMTEGNIADTGFKYNGIRRLGAAATDGDGRRVCSGVGSVVHLHDGRPGSFGVRGEGRAGLAMSVAESRTVASALVGSVRVQL
jgi:hypothetical protein